MVSGWPQSDLEGEEPERTQQLHPLQDAQEKAGGEAACADLGVRSLEDQPEFIGR